MDKMAVQGGSRLAGAVAASGSKNSTLPLIFASLLADGEHVFTNVPDLVDVKSACQLLEHLGCRTEFNKNTLRITVSGKKISKLLMTSFARCARVSFVWDHY
jgi:UDP-N-acetylglucosamine 1-carboxyvinyltransferase